MQTPGDRLKKTILWLKSQGYIKEQNDVAIFMGISKGYLSQLVCNQKPLSESFVARYKELFDVINTDYIIPGKGKMVSDGQVKYHNSLVMRLQKKLIEQMEINHALQAQIIKLQSQSVQIRRKNKTKLM